MSRASSGQDRRTRRIVIRDANVGRAIAEPVLNGEAPFAHSRIRERRELVDSIVRFRRRSTRIDEKAGSQLTERERHRATVFVVDHDVIVEADQWRLTTEIDDEVDHGVFVEL